MYILFFDSKTLRKLSLCILILSKCLLTNGSSGNYLHVDYNQGDFRREKIFYVTTKNLLGVNGKKVVYFIIKNEKINKTFQEFESFKFPSGYVHIEITSMTNGKTSRDWFYDELIDIVRATPRTVTPRKPKWIIIKMLNRCQAPMGILISCYSFARSCIHESEMRSFCR